MAARDDWGLYIRLSVMMFLEFAVWGAWSVLIATHMLANLQFTGTQLALVFGTTAIGAMLAPLIAGNIADRFAPNQYVTAICHLLGAALLFVAFRQTTFAGLWWVMMLYACTYMPTIALTNGIAFHHMGDSEKFGNVRVWGTIGWIAIQTFNSFYLRRFGDSAAQDPHTGDVLIIAAIVAVIMAVYCLTLPNTPPAERSEEPYAFLKAFRLCHDRNFLVLLVISFLVATELPWYYNLTQNFFTEQHVPGLGLGGLDLTPGDMQLATTIGQWGEILMMFVLAVLLKRLGIRWTIMCGIIAWPLRYAIFALGEPKLLVICSQALHGVGYACFMAAAMIAVERMAPRDIRASAQSLLIFATNGVGMLIGHFASGPIHDMFKLQNEQGDYHNWAMVFAIPIIVTTLAAIAWVVLFDQNAYLATTARIAAESPGSALGAAVTD